MPLQQSPLSDSGFSLSNLENLLRALLEDPSRTVREAVLQVLVRLPLASDALDFITDYLDNRLHRLSREMHPDLEISPVVAIEAAGYIPSEKLRVWLEELKPFDSAISLIEDFPELHKVASIAWTRNKFLSTNSLETLIRLRHSLDPPIGLSDEDAGHRIADQFAELADDMMQGRAECRPGEGNYIVQMAYSGFRPQFQALFNVYLSLHSRVVVERDEWEQQRSEHPGAVNRGGFVALSWQIAWAAGCCGLSKVIEEISPRLSASSEEERLAAAHFFLDVIKYIARPSMIEFGGGGGPDDVVPLPGQVIAEDESWIPPGLDQSPHEAQRIEEELIFSPPPLPKNIFTTRDKPPIVWTPDHETHEAYVPYEVYYGTDRCKTNKQDVYRYYGRGRAKSLELGICKVTIPKNKKIGELPRPKWWKLQREDRSKHVVLCSVEPLDRPEFSVKLKDKVQQSKQKEAFVFVHGYNVSFSQAACRTAQLAHDLDFDGAPVFYSWPSQGRLLGYLFDSTFVRQTVPELMEFLRLVATESKANIIHLIAHSMGNQALTEVLRDFTSPSIPAGEKVFREVVLAAPDIDANVFERIILPTIRPKAVRITVYISGRDRALLGSHLLWGAPRIGRGWKDLRNIGVDIIDASEVNLSWLGHSYIVENNPVLRDLHHVLKGASLPRHPLRLNKQTGMYYIRP